MPTHPRLNLCLTLATLALLTACGQNTATQPITAQPAASEPAEPAVEPEGLTGQTAPVPAALQRTTATGFLSDYSRLTQNPLHTHSRIERSDKIEQYKSFIIDLPKVLPANTVRGKPIDPANAAQLAADLKAAASEAIGINFKLADKPGPGVARMRSAITQVAESYHDLDSPSHKIGGASLEMEIVDSVTGERLAAATESEAVTSRDPQLKSTDPYYDARLVFQSWSSRLAKWLTDEQPQ